jgi:hypothetical protein
MEVTMLSLRRSTKRIARKIEGFLLLLFVSAALSSFALAQQGVQQAAQKPAPKAASSATAKPSSAAAASPQKLPLRRVVLYKSGIGYFEHDGHVRGNEDVEIELTSSQLNDVLKSLTALDFSGGRIVGASYNSQEPSSHQLDSLSVPVAQTVTLPELLRQVRGAHIEVRASSGSFTGRLVSVNQESHTSAGGDEWKTDGISVLDDSGNVHSFSLDTSTAIRFADRDLEAQLQRALGLLDSAHQEDARHVVLSTAGTGERQIRVSYISEVPVWKTTYRIVLPGKSSASAANPLLQGWAVVDNTVGEDWNDIELSLAAGAPQSFIQQLSQPYYMQRPTVGLPRGVLLYPQTHYSTLSGGNHSIEGTILDPDGKVVVGATVLSTNASTQQSARTTTDDDGHYSFDSLPPGTYTVAVSMANFKTTVFNSVRVAPGRSFNLDGKLEVGAATVSVQVETGGQQVLETQATSVSNTVIGRSISTMPYSSRSSVLLGRLDPKTQTSGGPRNSAFEGLPKGTINMTFDGINNQDQVLASNGGFFAINDPRVDDVENFGISSNSPEAFLALSSSVNVGEDASLGDLFEYKLKDRVTIRKNQSALVPIVQTDINAEKVALWNTSLAMARPLRALWVTNSSSLVLDGGSFSVIEDGVFAGEGLIDSMHPGEKRLISYAADLAMQVVAKQASAPQVLTHIRAARGVLIRTVESRSKTSYTIRNEDSIPRTLILEQPIRQGWKLAGDLKPEETSATTYRFRIAVPAMETKIFVVEETSPTSSQVSLNNLNQQLIQGFVTRGELSPELEKSLRQILAQKDAIAKLDADLKQDGDELDDIDTDQDRLRQNLNALKGTAEEKALAQRYVSELNDQENRLGTLKKEIADLEAKRKQAQKELDDAIEHFTFDEKMDK